MSLIQPHTGGPCLFEEYVDRPAAAACQSVLAHHVVSKLCSMPRISSKLSAQEYIEYFDEMQCAFIPAAH